MSPEDKTKPRGQQNDESTPNQADIRQWLREQLIRNPLLVEIENQMDPSFTAIPENALITTPYRMKEMPLGELSQCEGILYLRVPSADLSSGKSEQRQITLWPYGLLDFGRLKSSGVPVGVGIKFPSSEDQQLDYITIGRTYPYVNQNRLITVQISVNQDGDLKWRVWDSPDFRSPRNEEKNLLRLEGSTRGQVVISATDKFPKARGFRFSVSGKFVPLPPLNK